MNKQPSRIEIKKSCPFMGFAKFPEKTFFSPLRRAAVAGTVALHKQQP
jgi:hypothetical protein